MGDASLHCAGVVRVSVGSIPPGDVTHLLDKSTMDKIVVAGYSSNLATRRFT
jgi:hypothetical protein